MPPHELYRILFILFTVACMMMCIPKEQWESNCIAVGADKGLADAVHPYSLRSTSEQNTTSIS